MRRLLLLLALVPGAALAAEAPAPAIDPAAAQHLRRMSDYLSSLQTFRVDSQVVEERVTTDGQKLQFVADSHVTLRRPNRLRTDRVGPATDVIIRYDGKTFSVAGKRTGYYAIAPAPPTLEAAIDVARDRFGIEAPAADLWVSHPYDELMSGVRAARYIDEQPIDGVMCHHLAFQGTDTDWQIWIQDGPQPLPRRYVITTKDVRGHPEFMVSLSHWEPNAPVAENEFMFVPPPGGQRIELMPLLRERGAR
jgi:hypothetical protein